MRKIITIMGLVIILSCNNSGHNAITKDTTTINSSNNNNAADGGPDNGMGDTNKYNRSNDTVSHDTTAKK